MPMIYYSDKQYVTRGTSGRRYRPLCHGFTLIEIVLGSMALSVAIAAILGAYIGQVTLNEYARNLSLAIQDANRVIEQLREQNSPCADAVPSALPPPLVPPPGNYATWDAWLAADAVAGGGGGKSIQPSELLILTPQNRDGTQAWADGNNPIRVTVAVCWRHRNRTIGECTWNGTSLSANPGAGGDPLVTESPAMLTTLVTCR